MTHEQARDTLTEEMQSIHDGLVNSPRAFCKAVEAECFLSEAFLSPAEQARKLTFRLAPDRVKEGVEMQTEAGKALHRIWRTYMTNDAALTGNERALAKYLAHIVTEAVGREAERSLDSFGVEGLRRAGM